MGLSSSERKGILSEAEHLRPVLCESALKIWKNPELAFKEIRTSKLLQGFLEAEGFKIETGLAGLKTSFRAYSRSRSAKPAVGFLAEMDALPGLGHACGHNLIGASGAGAAACLRRALPEIPGIVEVIGCPAEESGGGKVRLARIGVFDHLAAAMMVHPDTKTQVIKLSLALIEVRLVFLGRAAHASAEHQKGISALEPLLETFNRVNALRDELPNRGWIHGIITRGGQAPNIIPDHTEALFYIRGRTMEEAKALLSKVKACARKAAESCGARVRAEVNTREAYEPFVPNRSLGRVFEKHLVSLGLEIDPGLEDDSLGSSDVGNVSQRVPAISPVMKIPGLSAACHTKGFARAAGSSAGMEMMIQAVKAMALTGAELMKDASLRKKVRDEFRRTAGAYR